MSTYAVALLVVLALALLFFLNRERAPEAPAGEIKHRTIEKELGAQAEPFLDAKTKLESSVSEAYALAKRVKDGEPESAYEFAAKKMISSTYSLSARKSMAASAYHQIEVLHEAVVSADGVATQLEFGNGAPEDLHTLVVTYSKLASEAEAAFNSVRGALLNMSHDLGAMGRKLASLHDQQGVDLVQGSTDLIDSLLGLLDQAAEGAEQASNEAVALARKMSG